MANSTATLPGVEDEQAPERIVAHVDMDCFYAACERRREPALADEPVIVGMGYEPDDDGGVVATASYEAREHGVESAQPISDALAALPRASVMPDDYAGPVGHYRPVDMEYYEAVSEEVRAILEEVSERIRIASLDEAYLDISERTSWAEAEAFGTALKRRIASETDLPASVGIAPTRGVAKIASDHDKPDGLTVVPPEAVTGFLADLPLEALHGVGPVTAETLHGLCLETIGDIAAVDPSVLEEHFGERGHDLAARARGEGPSEVIPQGKPKSLSRESSLGGATAEYERIADTVRTLAEAVAERAEAHDAQYRTVGIKVVTPPFDVNTREQTFPGPFSDADLVTETALELLDEFRGAEVRKVGVRVANLDFAADQVSLGNWADETTSASATEDGPTVPRQGRLGDFEE